jgi:hypothetical protein
MQQLRTVQLMMDKDRQRRQQANNNTTDHNQIHSPYSGQARSQVSASDGRPLMRPITPLKSSQAMRQMQHSTNTSHLTTNNNYSQQPAQFNGGEQSIPGGEYEEAEPDRNLPSEMKHRPKIPRTPSQNERAR